jgi:hypothetical protein
MTQSEPSKKPQPAVAKAVEAEAPKKTKLEELLDRLKEEKPALYEQYVNAAKNKRPVWVYPDLTLRIG